MDMYRYTFNPPEEELVSYYLNNKINGNDADLEAGRQINEVNICQYEPMDLPGLAKIESSHTWYFISPVEKFGRLNRRKRATRTGNWKITGNNSKVKDIDGNPIGVKKFLVFQENKRSTSSSTTTQQNKTHWIIHEFHSSLHHRNKDAFVLCKLMKKARTRRTSATVNVSPAAIDMSPSLTLSDSVLSHSQNVNTEDNYGRDCDGLEEFLPEFDRSISNWLDHSHDVEHFYGGSFYDTTQSWGQREIQGLSVQETGHVYGHNIIDNSKTLEAFPQQLEVGYNSEAAVVDPFNYQI